jgi:hypothetical protein
MGLLKHFRINTPTVIHETIDDEVVIIDFDSGSYYSLDKVGADIWNLLQDGAAVTEIVQEVARRYEGRRVDIEEAVNRLIAELQQENIIVSDGVREPERFEESVQISLETEKLSFEAPALQKYTDMQELLLLDPIHEVDEAGWPNVKLDPLDGDE